MTEKNLPGDGPLAGFKNYSLQFLLCYNIISIL